MRLDDWYIDYEYDSNGNLLSSSKNSEQDYVGNQCEYTYNAWGQLTNYSDSLGQSAEYAYYPDGLRSSKKIGSNTIKYYYNGDTVINETKNGSQLATNVDGVDGFISRYQNGRDNYSMFNAHGDTTLVFTGWRTGEYHYNAWGKDLSNYNYWSDANPIRYSGEYYDTESGMQYLRGRYYSPEIRRFITEDPAKDGLNWYAYCGNNPIMYVDPWGFSYDEVINALEQIYSAKAIMNSSSQNSFTYNVALGSARNNKEIIKNSDIYIENWSGLTSILNDIVNGNNNSLEKIQEIKEKVLAAKNEWEKVNLRDDLIFITVIGGAALIGIKSGSILSPSNNEIRYPGNDPNIPPGNG